MRILWILTKPPWPADEGGKRVVWDTLRAFAEQDVEITLVAPVSPAVDKTAIERALGPYCKPILLPSAPMPRWRAALSAQLFRRPTTIERHSSQPVRQTVATLVEQGAIDLVLCEQVQSFRASSPARAAGIPTVLRAQNVESDLWRAVGDARWWMRPLLSLEAHRLAAFEGRAVSLATAVTTLTDYDAKRLRELSGGEGRVVAIAAPFDVELPAADTPFEGEPSLVLFGASGWWPNRAGAQWFREKVWPAVRKAQPDSRLHLYSADLSEKAVASASAEQISLHPSPRESREAFAPNSIQIVPIHVASGVRIKILEAWARGVPVVATTIAARGLNIEDRREIFLANDPVEFSQAITELSDPECALKTVQAAREKLRAEHAAEKVAALHLELYDELYSAMLASGGRMA